MSVLWLLSAFSDFCVCQAYAVAWVVPRGLQRCKIQRYRPGLPFCLLEHVSICSNRKSLNDVQKRIKSISASQNPKSGMATGRFGLGYKSVFSFTDVGSFVTGAHLAVCGLRVRHV